MTLQEHLRYMTSKLRVSPVPLSVLIPLLQEAADELDRQQQAIATLHQKLETE